MQLQIDVDNVKSNLFLELLNIFKKDEMITNYKIIDTQEENDSEILDDLHMIGESLKDAKNGLGSQTSKTVSIQDI